VDGRHAAEELIDEVAKQAERCDEVTLGSLLDELGARSYAPFLILPPLIEFTPLGGIPGVPTALAVAIAVFAVQIIAGVDHIWVPGFVEKRSIEGEKLLTAIDKVRGVAEWVDDHTGERLPWLVGEVPKKVAGVAVLVLCCMVPPLEFVPFASSAPMAAIAMFGLAILARDGVLMLLGLLGSAGVTALLIHAASTGFGS
jgi:hypothetical protein